MPDDEQPRLSTSERRRQLALDHVRAAREKIETTPRVRPVLHHEDAGGPPPPIPSETAHQPDGTADLAAAMEAVSTMYEMEQSAHRHTTDQLIAQQKAHIASLQRLVDELSARLARDQTG